MIDLAKEWEQFEVNVQKKSGWGMRRIGVVAASVLIFLLIGMLWQPTEIETVKVVREAELIGKKSAELILANGQRIDLEKQIVELREENGIHISNSTQSYLAYRQERAAGIFARRSIFRSEKSDGMALYRRNGTHAHTSDRNPF